MKIRSYSSILCVVLAAALIVCSPAVASSQKVQLKNGPYVTLCVIKKDSNQQRDLFLREFSEQMLVVLQDADDTHLISAQVDDGATAVVAGAALCSKKDADGDVFLKLLAIDNRYREQGIGSALVQYIQKFTDCTTVSAEAGSSAAPFYRACGFKEETPYVFVKRFK